MKAKFDLFQKSINFDGNSVEHILEQTQIIRTKTPVFENISGIGSDFSLKDTVIISLKIGYEIQVWFRQNKFIKMFSISGKSVNDDFSLSGLNASLKFQF